MSGKSVLQKVNLIFPTF